MTDKKIAATFGAIFLDLTMAGAAYEKAKTSNPIDQAAVRSAVEKIAELRNRLNDLILQGLASVVEADIPGLTAIVPNFESQLGDEGQHYDTLDTIALYRTLPGTGAKVALEVSSDRDMLRDTDDPKKLAEFLGEPAPADDDEAGTEALLDRFVDLIHLDAVNDICWEMRHMHRERLELA